MKIKICSIGECMLEFVNAKNSSYIQSIAGDTLNFSSYLDKKIFDTTYFTAVGSSEISNRILNFLKKKKINTRLIHKSKSHEVGLYLIENDHLGEKIFYYWRDNSAAKLFFNNKNLIQYAHKLKKFKYIYFSGVTLSLFEDKNIDNFTSLLKILKKNQAKIIFDLNIRRKRWSKQKLDKYFSKSIPLVDILFASGEDLNLWQGKKSYNCFKTLMNKHNIKHGIYRYNAKFNYAFFNNKKYFANNKILKKVVDTSGAGDGYNAIYLSTFFKHNDVQLALETASKIGSKIVMKKGAIIL